MENTHVMNELFIEKIAQDPQGLMDEAGAYVRTRLREVSFARKILTPEYITRAECQRSEQHDQPVKIVDIEPNSKAMAINYRGAPDFQYVMGTRYTIPFYLISSLEFQKTEEELLVYEMPLLDLVEKNAVLDIETIEDEGFIARVHAASILASKNVNYSGGADSWESLSMPKKTFVQLMNTLENSANTGTEGKHNFDAKRYKTDVILMNQEDFNSILLWAASDVGNDFSTEVTINGYTYATLMGKKIVVTIKGELVPPRVMYGFAAKEYMGHSYILGDTKFWIDKRKNIITFSAYENIGSGIGNAYAVTRIYA